jgi:hypothetical protein
VRSLLPFVIAAAVAILARGIIKPRPWSKTSRRILGTDYEIGKTMITSAPEVNDQAQQDRRDLTRHFEHVNLSLGIEIIAERLRAKDSEAGREP